MKVFVKIIYDRNEKMFRIRSDVSNEETVEIVEKVLLANVDSKTSSYADEYTIIIEADALENKFSMFDNCRDKSLRNGLLIQFLGSSVSAIWEREERL